MSILKSQLTHGCDDFREIRRRKTASVASTRSRRTYPLDMRRRTVRGATEKRLANGRRTVSDDDTTAPTMDDNFENVLTTEKRRRAGGTCDFHVRNHRVDELCFVGVDMLSLSDGQNGRRVASSQRILGSAIEIRQAGGTKLIRPMRPFLRREIRRTIF
ncbi:unnamed protein product [Nesidiocoris tenuis]|uniref:Uncharacterized protein n=1 Tax=Nesidiocoris tenuis TaxID=355587 RepID=A0A6H5G0K7_9HEMI|nr:unnamed protein product [Nesidiocoris tenuis]